ncbi:MAG: hypothetical protein K2Y08_00560 [Alphaproteobacteria bacterium]|nr:hypothetical protein [Alphaproteobacteria bacterium]
MKKLTLTSLVLGIVFLLGVNSATEAIASNQNNSNVVMAYWRNPGPYYYGPGPYYYGPGPGYYYGGPLLCVGPLCI